MIAIKTGRKVEPDRLIALQYSPDLLDHETIASQKNSTIYSVCLPQLQDLS